MSFHNPQHVSATVVEKLLPAEISLTEALAGNAELLATLARAKLDNALALGLGHGVLRNLHEAQAAIFDATTRTMRAHAGLETLQRKLGLPEVSVGSGEPKYDDGLTGGITSAADATETGILTMDA